MKEKSVKLISVTPDAEKTMAHIARVSNPDNQDNPNYAGLLKYCIKHNHWSVFEQSSMTLEIETTRAIAAQILRHRSFTFQEFSQRYAQSNELGKIELPDLRRQDLKNRQNSTDDLDDFIVRKKDSSPTFMFANAIDDSLMEVDLVLRGDDHLSNTPRQIALLNALSLSIPKYAHVSLFTGTDGAPLSKRNGSLSVNDLREMGYLPIAVANYLSRVGHKMNDNDLKTLKELADSFQTKNISSSPSKFDSDQLLFWQKKAVDNLTIDECGSWLSGNLDNLPPTVQERSFIELIKGNINFPNEAREYVNNLFINALSGDEENLRIIKSAGQEFFILALEVVTLGISDWKQTCKDIETRTGKKGKELFMPLRVAITGQTRGPELDKVIELIGFERVLERLNEASQI